MNRSLSQLPLLSPLQPTLTSIVCDPRVIAIASEPDWMQQAMSEGGWPFEESDEGMSQCIQALNELGGSPLLSAYAPDGALAPCYGKLDHTAPRATLYEGWRVNWTWRYTKVTVE